MLVEIIDADENSPVLINLAQVKFISKSSKGGAVFNFTGETTTEYKPMESTAKYEAIVAAIASHNQDDIVEV